MKHLTLKDLRKVRGLTLKQSGVDITLLSKIENGKQNLTLQIARTLAKTYQVSIDIIVRAFDEGGFKDD